MTIKLTLSMNKKTVDKAKQYAKKHQLNLSQLVENHLETIVALDKLELNEISHLSIQSPLQGQELEFAEIRAKAMFASLTALGRYDEIRVRNRLLIGYKAGETKAIYLEDVLIGFYSIEEHEEYAFLSHFYFLPEYSGRGFGSQIMEQIKAQCAGKTLRLLALKGSGSNAFYIRHGFVKTHEEEFDTGYELIL